MFTDWSQTDPHYFFERGALYGVVLTCIVIFVVVPGLGQLRRYIERKMFKC